MFPQISFTKSLLARTYEWNGKYDEAIEKFQEIDSKHGIMMCYAWMGKREDAQKMFDEWKKEQGINPISNAMFNAVLGEKDKAIAILEQAVEEHNPRCEWMIAMPTFDNLRSDPRFIALLEEMGIEG